MIYSLKLRKELKFKLHNLDFTVVLPQKTTIANLFYLTHNHISVFFCIEINDIIVQFILDERRNPDQLQTMLEEFN